MTILLVVDDNEANAPESIQAHLAELKRRGVDLLALSFSPADEEKIFGEPEAKILRYRENLRIASENLNLPIPQTPEEVSRNLHSIPSTHSNKDHIRVYRTMIHIIASLNLYSQAKKNGIRIVGIDTASFDLDRRNRHMAQQLVNLQKEQEQGHVLCLLPINHALSVQTGLSRYKIPYEIGVPGGFLATFRRYRNFDMKKYPEKPCLNKPYTLKRGEKRCFFDYLGAFTSPLLDHYPIGSSWVLAKTKTSRDGLFATVLGLDKTGEKLVIETRDPETGDKQKVMVAPGCLREATTEAIAGEGFFTAAGDVSATYETTVRFTFGGAKAEEARNGASTESSSPPPPKP